MKQEPREDAPGVDGLVVVDSGLPGWASLRKVASLNPRLIYPGRGRAWRRDGDPGRLFALIEGPEASSCADARLTTSSSNS
jgi:hypothetical protein